MNATELEYPDNHFDVVFSSMFLHELPLKDIRAYLREAFRVLKPGGLLLTMELPPNSNLGAYEQFYLDWDCYYNNEPFYKAFRDQNYTRAVHRRRFPRRELLRIRGAALHLHGRERVPGQSGRRAPSMTTTPAPLPTVCAGTVLVAGSKFRAGDDNVTDCNGKSG